MRQLVQYEFADGSRALAEATSAGGGVVPVAAPGDVAVKAKQTFEEALGTLRPTVDAFVQRFGELTVRPDEARLEFELGLDVEAGMFIAQVGGSASFKVALMWRAAGV